uniref:Uncharacterized protein n=1 Tax=Oryza meridionalis TaxID=40149 RepID=A0A0E0E3U7_9ORYZ
MEATVFAPHQVAIPSTASGGGGGDRRRCNGEDGRERREIDIQGGTVMRRSTTLGGIESDHGSLMIL